MSADNPETAAGRIPDDPPNVEAKRLIESINREFGLEQYRSAPDWSDRNAGEAKFADEALAPEARVVAGRVLDRMMGALQYPLLRRGYSIDPLLIWQSYDASRNIVNSAAPSTGTKPAEITLNNILGAAKRAEAWFHSQNEYHKDESYLPDIRDYQLMQRSISDALVPVAPPSVDSNP